MLIATVDQVGPNSFNVVDYNLYDWLMEFWSQIYKDTGDSGLCWHLPKKKKKIVWGPPLGKKPLTSQLLNFTSNPAYFNKTQD